MKKPLEAMVNVLKLYGSISLVVLHQPQHPSSHYAYLKRCGCQRHSTRPTLCQSILEGLPLASPHKLFPLSNGFGSRKSASHGSRYCVMWFGLSNHDQYVSH